MKVSERIIRHIYVDYQDIDRVEIRTMLSELKGDDWEIIGVDEETDMQHGHCYVYIVAKEVENTLEVESE